MLVDIPGQWASTARYYAKKRALLHAGHGSSRPLSEGYEYVGLLGEVAFGLKFGLSVDLSDRPSGDEYDFKIGGITIDVKTARKAYNLLREAHKPHADILVLAQYLNEDKILFKGWEYDEAMLKQHIKDFGYNIKNHFKPSTRLRPMAELQEMIDEIKDSL